jgi:heat shock protein HtpX
MYSAIARNKRNTWLILAGFIIVLGLIGLAAGWLAGNNWWISAFVLLGATGYATVQYFVADREALALSGAQEVTREEAPRYYRIVENLCLTTGPDAAALRRRGCRAQRVRDRTHARACRDHGDDRPVRNHDGS